MEMQSKKIIKPKKSLGQNFLQNPSICEKIVNQSLISCGDLILEIGPGQLALTKQLIKTCTNFILIEKDDDCFEFVVNFFRQQDFYIKVSNDFTEIKNDNYKILIFKADALKIDIQNIIRTFNETFNTNFDNLKIVANLPYNVATLLIYKWCERDFNVIKSITIMLQKEVAKRIAAKNNSKDYGKLSVICQLLFDCRILFDVSPDNFFPKPKVTSSIIKLDKLDNIIIDLNKMNNFSNFLTKIFNNRRKTLLNVFKSSGLDFVKLQNSNNNSLTNILTKRVEDLSPNSIVNLFHEVG